MGSGQVQSGRGIQKKNCSVLNLVEVVHQICQDSGHRMSVTGPASLVKVLLAGPGVAREGWTGLEVLFLWSWHQCECCIKVIQVWSFCHLVSGYNQAALGNPMGGVV